MEKEARYASAKFPHLQDIILLFLRECGVEAGSPEWPRVCSICVAGPVQNQVAQLTNLSWTLDANKLKVGLKIPHVYVMNDFMGVGFGLLGLEAHQ